MDDQAIHVHRYLRLDRLLFLLAGVMRSPLALCLGSRDLLFCGVEEGFEAWKECLHLVKGSQPPDFLVEPPWQRQGLFHMGLEHAYIF